MADAVISYTDEATGTVFRWHGGAYIEVGYYSGTESEDGVDQPWFHANDVINVWDDEADRSRFETDAADDWQGRKYVGRPFRHILEAFEARCREYLNQADEEEA